MILLDTGPVVALFDPKDSSHPRCREVLKTIREPLVTTVPVLTEAFHMLSPGSRGADRARDFIAQRGATIWFFNDAGLRRAFELMEQFMSVHEHPEVAREELHRWFTLVYRNPAGTNASGVHGTREQVAERLDELVTLGANHLLLNPICRYAEQVEALAAAVGLP